MSLFQNVQNDDTAFEDEDELDAEVDYDEFKEAIAAIACVVMPNPYFAFEQRIETFLLTRLFVGEKKQKKSRKKKKDWNRARAGSNSRR